MTPDPKSLEEMTPRQRSRWWPALSNENYHKTSNETNIYNCVAWITGNTEENIDFSHDEDGDLLADLSSTPYIKYFEEFGFQICDNPLLEVGIEKIAIFETKNGYFEHVARQLENGHWTSKMAEYEDIEHYSLEALENPNFYGQAKIFLQRARMPNS